MKIDRGAWVKWSSIIEYLVDHCDRKQRNTERVYGEGGKWRDPYNNDENQFMWKDLPGGHTHGHDRAWKLAVVEWVVLNDHTENLAKAAKMSGTLEELEQSSQLLQAKERLNFAVMCKKDPLKEFREYWEKVEQQGSGCDAPAAPSFIYPAGGEDDPHGDRVVIEYVRALAGHSIKEVNESRYALLLTEADAEFLPGLVHGTMCNVIESVMWKGLQSSGDLKIDDGSRKKGDAGRNMIHFSTYAVDEISREKAGMNGKADTMVYMRVRQTLKRCQLWLSRNGAILSRYKILAEFIKSIWCRLFG